MKKIDQRYRCWVLGQVIGLWKLQCRLQIFFPHPEVQTVVISEVRQQGGRFSAYRVEHLATLIVHDFRLDPSLIVWIEQSPQANACVRFNQIDFSWLNGQARRPQRFSISGYLAEALMGEKLAQSVC